MINAQASPVLFECSSKPGTTPWEGFPSRESARRLLWVEEGEHLGKPRIELGSWVAPWTCCRFDGQPLHTKRSPRGDLVTQKTRHGRGPRFDP